ncbi:MAG: hypothetical protein IIC73_08950 [Armatimonadetes bacterium]|nr:hypothetical protein [Armatimonadota bacterium]
MSAYWVRDMITFDDGSGPALFIAGRIDTLNGNPVKNIMKWDGSQWTQPGEGLEGVVYDLHVWRHDGVEELVAVGDITMAGTQPAENIAVWNGKKWRAFDELGADERVTKVATVELPWRQSIFFAGNFDTIGGVYSPGLVEWVCYECRANCDDSTGQGVLDLFDFLCFQNAFVSEQAYACDCDVTTGPGVCDLFDFICFQDAFVAGCP